MSRVAVSSQGRAYAWEETAVYNKRNDIAAAHIRDGLSYKHAWFKAFQEVPRTYVDPVDNPPFASLGGSDSSGPSLDDRV